MKNDETTSWSSEEIERTLEALKDTPPLLAYQRVDGVYRMKRASQPDNPAASHGPDIVLYDAAFEEKYNLTHVLDHEFSHHLYQSMPDSEQRSFAGAGKWKTTGQPTPGRPENQFLRKNGMLSPEEDFADDVTIYIHQPKELKRVAPGVYQWMESHMKPRLEQRSWQ